MGSYLAARREGGQWLLRVEDLDPPREAPGGAEQIIAALEAFGFEWSGSILRQSTRGEAYEAALTKLLNQGLAFPCSCSRAELQTAQTIANPQEDLRYPGWCRSGVLHPDRTLAVRFRVPDEPIEFDDQLQGIQRYRLRDECGDFVIRRRDQLYAYQLAVVVDDADQGVTHVVRGVDLLSSTPRQIVLQRALGLPTPVYAHLPVVTDANGIKLSKSTGAAAINLDRPSAELWRALRCLRQSPPPELRNATLAAIWDWAIQHWRAPPLFGLRNVALEDAT